MKDRKKDVGRVSKLDSVAREAAQEKGYRGDSPREVVKKGGIHRYESESAKPEEKK